VINYHHSGAIKLNKPAPLSPAERQAISRAKQTDFIIWYSRKHFYKAVRTPKALVALMQKEHNQKEGK